MNVGSDKPVERAKALMRFVETHEDSVLAIIGSRDWTQVSRYLRPFFRSRLPICRSEYELVWTMSALESHEFGIYTNSTLDAIFRELNGRFQGERVCLACMEYLDSDFRHTGLIPRKHFKRFCQLCETYLQEPHGPYQEDWKFLGECLMNGVSCHLRRAERSYATARRPGAATAAEVGEFLSSIGLTLQPED